MMMTITAAAAALSMSGPTASVSVPLIDLRNGDARTMLTAAAQKACRSIGLYGLAAGSCVEDAAAQAMRDYHDRLRGQHKVVLVTSR